MSALPAGLEELKAARGYFQHLHFEDGRMGITGWMFSPGSFMVKAAILLNRRVIAEVELAQSEEIRETYARFPEAARARFEAYVSIGSLGEANRLPRIDVVGLDSEDVPKAKISTVYLQDFREAVPVPPAELMQRVANTTSPLDFAINGMRHAGDFFHAIESVRGIGPGDRFLDWGCGCGRLSGLFRYYIKGIRSFGCDIDGEAIEWCRGAFDREAFSTIPPSPPTQYASGTFDVIIGYSVLTHLDAQLQNAWLVEMSRLLAPDGVFLATVHGPWAALFHPDHKEILEQLQGKGISDGTPDPSLDGIAPPGYYRATFQSPEYTREQWSRFFDSVEYRERGLGGYQDLVIGRSAKSTR